MTPEQMARLQAWARGAPVEEPPVVTEPTHQSRGTLCCDYCGETFTAAQFNAWLAHECDGLRAYRESL